MMIDQSSAKKQTRGIIIQHWRQMLASIDFKSVVGQTESHQAMKTNIFFLPEL